MGHRQLLKKAKVKAKAGRGRGRLEEATVMMTAATMRTRKTGMVKGEERCDDHERDGDDGDSDDDGDGAVMGDDAT